LRAFENEYGGNGQDVFGWSSQLLIGQFYDSTPTTNALGMANPYDASDEVDISCGDSGGPSFYDGEIVGVHDLIICSSTVSEPSSCTGPPSENILNDPYFGKMFADTSVADNSTFIEDAEVVPEPAACSLVPLGLTVAGFLRRRTGRRPS
jgi:hypothetical protein